MSCSRIYCLTETSAGIAVIEKQTLPRVNTDHKRAAFAGSYFFLGTTFNWSAARIFLIWLRAWIDQGPIVSSRA